MKAEKNGSCFELKCCYHKFEALKARVIKAKWRLRNIILKALLALVIIMPSKINVSNTIEII